MSVQVTHHELNNVQVLSIAQGDLTISEDKVEEVSGQLLDYTVSIPPQIVVDLQNVDFFGSSFIETLFRMWNRVKASPDGHFALCGLRPYCLEVLEVTNLNSVWPIYPDVETATKAISELMKEDA